MELIIPKMRIPYYNHKRNKYIFAVNTYILLLYNPIMEKKMMNEI